MNEEMKKLKDNSKKPSNVGFIDAVLLIAIGFFLALWMFGDSLFK